MQWTSKLKTSHTWGKDNLENLLKCIEHSDDPTLKNCLFGAVTLTKKADVDSYGYSGYGIDSDRKSIFSFPGGGFGQNVLIFGADMSSSVHVDNKKRHISSSKSTNTRIRTHINRRKNVFS